MVSASKFYGLGGGGLSSPLTADLDFGGNRATNVLAVQNDGGAIFFVAADGLDFTDATIASDIHFEGWSIHSINQIDGANGDSRIGVYDGELVDANGQTALSWFDRRAFDPSGNTVIDWQNLQLNDADNQSIDWGLRNLFDGSEGALSVNWSARILYDPTEVPVMWWDGGGIRTLATIVWPGSALSGHPNVWFMWDDGSGDLAIIWGEGNKSYKLPANKPAPKPIVDFSTDAGNTGTGETTLRYTVCDNQLNADHEKLTFEHTGTFVQSATASRRLRASFGEDGNEVFIYDSGNLTVNVASAAWAMRGVGIRVSSDTIRWSVTLQVDGIAFTSPVSYTEVTGQSFNSVVLRLTGQAAGTGAATNDIVAKMGSIVWSPAA